jgi:penicillin amidase
MSLTRLLLRAILGRRLPVTAGELRVSGPTSPITIRRDKWGVPHVDAASETDAIFALGFCQGQDRAAQLETLWRVGRGRLAEWVGPAGLPPDRMSRRIGFRRAAEQQLLAQPPDIRAILDAFTAGLNAGHSVGLSAKPHEFAILGGEPSDWDTADVLTILKLQSFLLPSNWDVELARLRVVLADGPDAMRELDPVSRSGDEEKRRGGDPTEDPASSPHLLFSSSPLLALEQDLAALQQYLPRGGGSNNWVIAGSRTASGKPLLASDPHLAPTIPPPWYLVHLRSPDWTVCGATYVGTPAASIGHNGFAAWGVTAGLTDNTDLFLETLGPDGASVREAGGSFAPCEVVREVIRVKGRPDVTEDVLVTPRGPVISPILDDIAHVVSLRAVWLDPLPVVGFLRATRATSFAEFCRCFEQWPAMSLNVVYADAGGTTGYQLVGQIPRRTGGNGLLPLPADAPGVGWAKELVPFDEMPFAANPQPGYYATANSAPPASGPFLGLDFCDLYRVAVIRDELGKRPVWDIPACQRLQTNLRSIPWEEVRDTLLSLNPADPDARDGLELLRGWDGAVTADSPAAAVFELFLAELCVRVAKAKAPNSWRTALGEGALGKDGHNLFSDRRTAHLVGLIRAQPGGWFARSWPEEMADVLGGVVRFLRRSVGPGPAYWAWGHIRRLRLEHLLFVRSRALGPAFNLGPFPIGGDANTVSQAGCRPADPTDFTHNMANLRTVFDLADLSKSMFSLCGGQSGNPCSPHYADLLPLWQAGEAVVLPWDQDQVIREATATLRLVPPG